MSLTLPAPPPLPLPPSLSPFLPLPFSLSKYCELPCEEVHEAIHCSLRTKVRNGLRPANNCVSDLGSRFSRPIPGRLEPQLTTKGQPVTDPAQEASNQVSPRFSIHRNYELMTVVVLSHYIVGVTDYTPGDKHPCCTQLKWSGRE